MHKEEEISYLLTLPQRKQIAVDIAHRISKNHQLMEELMECFFSDEKQICQRASWPLLHLSKEDYHLLYPYLPKMVDILDTPLHNAVQRNIVRILAEMNIPNDLEGIVYEKCYHILCDPQSAIANRVFSMTVCRKVAMKYPALKLELIEVIEDAMEMTPSPGILSRGKKEVKILTQKK